MTVLTLSIPRFSMGALSWVAETVLVKRLRLPITLRLVDTSFITIEAEGRILRVASGFPNLAEDPLDWAAQMPKLPLASWDPAQLPELDLEGMLPVLYGQPRIETNRDEIRCDIDIFGAIFFMLSRFEEVALPDRDEHDRFPATASIAWKEGFLDRPIVDEYVELLWAVMKRLWPGLQRKRRQGAIRVSCDVDHPFDPSTRNAFSTMRSVGLDILKRRDVSAATARVINYAAKKRGNFELDPFNTFDWYMSACERAGHQATFYFIADHSAGAIDGHYDIDEPRIIELLRSIDERGHKIGMHGSYNTYLDVDQISREKSRLSAALRKAGLRDCVRGNRQHFLRWSCEETPDHLAKAEIEYDTSGGYPHSPGFRFGTAHPFEIWSWKSRVKLRLIQRPLVAMEASLLSKKYLGLSDNDTLDRLHSLKKVSLKYGGDFAILWHNSQLASGSLRGLFLDAIDS